MDNRTIEEVRKNETKLINEIKVLEQRCKKQKELIDKISKIINYYGTDKEHNDNSTLRYILKNMLDILNEVK
jgi:hypothetical protein